MARAKAKRRTSPGEALESARARVGLLMERIATLEGEMEIASEDPTVPLALHRRLRHALALPLHRPDLLHQYGRCTCVGEGRCTWCRLTAAQRGGL